MIAVA